ncbi:MAG: sugar transporter permease [Chloroflexi bacterium]|nr:sugar transporter permease [Chloroflexota bacterium]
MGRQERRSPWLTDRRMAILFIAPSIILLLAISIFPLIWSVYLSFTRYRVTGTHPPKWIGLDNYRNILTQNDPIYDVWHQFQVTAAIVVTAVGLEFLLGFGLALLLVRKFPGRGLLLTLMLTPMMLAPVIVGLFWKFMLDASFGVVNYMQSAWFHFPRVDYVNQPTSATVAIIMADVWMWTPFMLLISVAGLSAIPKYLTEAALVDRASAWFRFRHITLPLVWPLLLIALLFRTIDAIKLFDLPFTLTGGGPGDATQTISYTLYQKAFNDYDTGSASALAYIILIMVIALANIYIRNLNKAAAA